MSEPLAGNVHGMIQIELIQQPVASSIFLIKEVGGAKGHQTEYIHGALRKLYESYGWKMIPNCTGRHTCRDHRLVTTLPPLDVLERADLLNTDGGQPLVEHRFSLPGRKDPVAIVPLDDANTTGVITFVKKGDDEEEPHYVHTLNTASGFRRKLEAIGILVTETGICVAEAINGCGLSTVSRQDG
jgi:hypothetical protein